VMTLGYLGFGSEAPDNVVVGFSAHYPVLGLIASIALIINVLISSPLYIFCVMSLFETSCSGRIWTPMTLPNIGFRIVLISTLCIIGSQLPYVTEIIGLVSSVFACCNNIFFPIIFHYGARQKALTTPRNPAWRTVKYVGAAIVGLCVLIFGVKGSLETLLTKLRQDSSSGLTSGINLLVE